MKARPRYIVAHRRRREGRTDYRQRLRLLKSGRARLVIRRSLNNMVCQIVRYGPKGDSVIATADSRELEKSGWKGHSGNIPASYLTGYLCGLRAKKAKVSSVVADMGVYRSVKGSRLYAALRGAAESGVDIPHSADVLPKQERAEGKHIADYAASLKKSDPEAYKKQFSQYIKNRLEPENLARHVVEVKAKLT